MQRPVSRVATALLASAALAAAAEPIPPAAEARTAAAIAFAAAHHPELVPLLERLRTEAPAEFAAAVAELDRTRERLAKLHERQPERHEAAVAEWKLSSRIRLSLARLATSPSAEAEAELREFVRQRAEARLARLRAERDRISARLEKITAQLDAFDRDPEAALAHEMEAVRAQAARWPPRSPAGRNRAAQPRAEPGAKPAAANPDSSSP